MKVKNVLLMCVSHKEVRQKQEIIWGLSQGRCVVYTDSNKVLRGCSEYTRRYSVRSVGVVLTKEERQ